MSDLPLPDEHAGELLSALADGELTATERVNVEVHLAVCSRCSREFETIERSRLAMMALPELDPPADFIAGMVRNRHLKLIRGGFAGFAVAVIAFVALLSADLLPERNVEPELAAFAADHSATVVTAPEAPTLSQTAHFPGITIDNDVIGFDLIAVSEDDDVVHVVFRQDKRVVSVFGQRGVVDWDSLPLDGRRLRIGGRDGWQARDESSTVLDVDGNVLTIVGGDAQIQAVVASQVVDAPGPGLWSRAHDAAQTVMGAFDFG